MKNGIFISSASTISNLLASCTSTQNEVATQMPITIVTFLELFVEFDPIGNRVDYPRYENFWVSFINRLHPYYDLRYWLNTKGKWYWNSGYS